MLRRRVRSRGTICQAKRKPNRYESGPEQIEQVGKEENYQDAAELPPSTTTHLFQNLADIYCKGLIQHGYIALIHTENGHHRRSMLIDDFQRVICSNQIHRCLIHNGLRDSAESEVMRLPKLYATKLFGYTYSLS